MASHAANSQMLMDTKCTKDMRNKSIKRIALLYYYSTVLLYLFVFYSCFVCLFLFFLALTDATRGGKNDRRPKSYSRRKGEI